MNIGLIDVDSHNFPNLALMKISAFHKSRGDHVEWWWGFGDYDIVYMSKVFDDTYSKDVDEPLNARKIIKGGTGYGLNGNLPEEIEHIYPDYSLYPELTKDTAYGFLTRGCPRHCSFCIVGDKEGLQSRKVADLSEWWHGQRYIKLLDPNITACKDRLDLLRQLADIKANTDDIKRKQEKQDETLVKMTERVVKLEGDSARTNKRLEILESHDYGGSK